MKQVAQTAGGGSTRLYIDNLYERDTAGSLTTHIHYIKAGGEIVALYKSKSNNSEETRYLHKDHLGSITVITNEAGAIAEELSYDPHGKRRNPDWSDALAQLQSFETKRSFTGHLYLDDVGLIHMGGRYYDPELGRFLSADPFIQEPANAQSLNRYSYVLNNPLSYTDPSGFFFSKLFKAIGKAIKAVVNFIKDNIKTIFAIALMAIPVANIYGAMALGFAAGMVASGGDLRAGIIGAITGGAMGIGNIAVRIATTALVGGVGSVVQGGKFLSGFLSAGVSVGFGAQIGGGAFSAGKLIATSVVGGVAAELGGGKFKNGAITGAMAYAIGHGVQEIRRTIYERNLELRTTVELRHKNIPGGDAIGNTNPDLYPQHAYVIVRDNLTGEEWIARAGPDGDGGNAIFGSIKGVTIRNVPGSTGDYGAQVNHSITVLTTDMAPQAIVDQLSAFTSSVNNAQISYNPLIGNSNSFAYQAVEVLTGARPPTQAWAPGAQTILRVD